MPSIEILDHLDDGQDPETFFGETQHPFGPRFEGVKPNRPRSLPLPGACPEGQHRNNLGVCVADVRQTQDCPAGQVRNSAGVCVAESVDPGGCPTGFHLSESGSHCVRDGEGSVAPTNVFFDDPINRWFSDLGQREVSRLQTPLVTPKIDSSMTQLQDLVNELRGPLNVPGLDEAQASLAQAIKRARALEVPTALTTAEQHLTSLLDQGNPDLDAFREFVMGTRLAELRGDPFSQQELATREVGMFDQFERERQQERRLLKEELAGMGHDPSSGLVSRRLEDLDRRYQTDRARMKTQLFLEEAALRRERESEADQLFVTLTELGFSEREAQTMIANSLAQVGTSISGFQLGKQGAITDASGAAGQLALGRGNLRATRDLGAANALSEYSDLARSLLDFREDRRQRSISNAALLPALQNENLTLALNLFGGGQSPF